MTLSIIVVSIVLLCATALITLLIGRSDKAALSIGTTGTALACVVGVASSLAALLGGVQSSLRATWSLSLGEFYVAVDALSSFFLICIFLVSGLSAIYGAGYLRAYLGRRRLAPALCFFDLLVASIATIAIARDAVLFLMAWEVMSITSFFLVTYENEREDVRRAGMMYLTASQFGVIFLFVLFALLARETGTFDFDTFATASRLSAGLANTCFLLALVGFGTKAGFWPVHIWLPAAHPVAPSHVSALMSGIMIKMGIYGLLRTLAFLGPPPAWWGATVIAIGAISGVLGVLHALAEHDLKRLLAYHSVENIGIIGLGLGLGLLGQSLVIPSIAFLGYAGCLLHVLNHGLFKSLLFHGAGSVLHGAATMDIDSLGALHRRMPTTATTFLIGSAAICGLPPLNGFVSEWLIYVGALEGSFHFPTVWAVSALVTIPVLALIGGLAATCFVKAFGIVFLGEPRSEAAANAHEAGTAMKASMITGALMCVAIGLWPTGAMQLVAPATRLLGHIPATEYVAAGSLTMITHTAIVLLLLVALFMLVRRALLRNREVTQATTWGCGYAAPSPRMQYTAASFAEPVLTPFASVVFSREVHEENPAGYFPSRAHFREHLGDLAEKLLVPGTRRALRTLSQLRVIQQGRLQLYLLYIAATLVVLLVWQLMGVGGR